MANIERIELIRNSQEFQEVDASWNNPETSVVRGRYSTGYGKFGEGTQAHPYELIHLDVALGAGLTGAGKVVAILDNGFLMDHRDLGVDREFGRYGTIGLADHGTHVAALIGGDMDDDGILGVAPDVQFFLSDWLHGDGGGSADVAWMAKAVEAATAARAIAHNNSWGWANGATVANVEARVSTGSTYYEALSQTINTSFTADDWEAYVDALYKFQETGVVVFAASNNERMTSADVASSMPAFFPDLEEAWIKSINGYFEVDGNGDITYAQRLSSGCFAEMATMCLAGDGTTYAPESGSTNDYGAGTGTSYFAPQVSGAVALISQAFPALTPAELTDRLLASADNSWFAGIGITANGSVDFGNGVVHSYSNEWGMGTLDLQAALNPIGSLTVAVGENLSTAERTSLDSATISTSSAFGDGLKASLSDVDMAVFDGLNANFNINAGDLVQTGGDSLADRMMDARRAAPGPGAAGSDADSFAFASFGSERRKVTARMGFTDDVAAFTGASIAKADLGDSSVLALTDGAFVAGAERSFGKLGFSAYAYVGGMTASTTA